MLSVPSLIFQIFGDDDVTVYRGISERSILSRAFDNSSLRRHTYDPTSSRSAYLPVKRIGHHFEFSLLSFKSGQFVYFAILLAKLEEPEL